MPTMYIRKYDRSPEHSKVEVTPTPCKTFGNVDIGVFQVGQFHKFVLLSCVCDYWACFNLKNFLNYKKYLPGKNVNKN